MLTTPPSATKKNRSGDDHNTGAFIALFAIPHCKR